HGGIAINISQNYVKGFVYGGIYAVNEGGNEENHEKFIRDVIISDNIVENDNTWYSNLTLADVGNSHPIQVGSYNTGTQYGVGSGGSIIVSKNIIKNCSVSNGGTDYLKYCIHSFAGTCETLQIKDNSIESSECVNAIYVGSGNDSGSQPKTVDISGNNMVDITSSDVLIQVVSGQSIQIKNNIANGLSISDAMIKVFNFGTGA